MPTFDLKQSAPSDYTNQVSDVNVPQKSTDAASGSTETTYQSTTWMKNLGFYKQIPECKIVVDTLSRWIIGDGYIADAETSVILDHIIGYGTDYFDDILENQIRTMLVDGDSYAEVIRDEDTEILINLKPLDPSSIRMVFNNKGVIIRYEQTSKSKDGAVKTFQPDQIFHLCRSRIADEIHGISIYEALETTINSLNESQIDTKKLMHFQVKPFILWKLKTDDTTTISNFVTKINNAKKYGEDMFIPDDDNAVSHEVIQTPISDGIFAWREDLTRNFYRNCGIPQILVGNASEFSESSSKIVYLSFGRTIEQEQRYIITQVWNQLLLHIDLPPPQSIINDMITDTQKDGANAQMGFQKNETTAGSGAGG